jgi:transglutaminase-like putative cysteine protease
MARLSIRHETTYHYGRLVAFGPQRLMVRPRDSHADWLVDASLELFLPSLGWMEFDPTNGLAESPDLIRVASTRMPEPPISGAIIGDPRSCAMSVKVDVRMMQDPARAAAAPEFTGA